MTRAGVYGINIVLETDDPKLIKSLLEFSTKEKAFDYKTKTLRYIDVHKKIYNRTLKNKKAGTQYYEVGIGWAAYILATLSNYLPIEDCEIIKRAIYSPTFRQYPFPELRDYQNDDVLHILKYQFGLCTVQTGYGKTQVISALAKYFSDLGKKILIVTPGTKARDEVVKRIMKTYGVPVSEKLGVGQIQAIITQGFLNQKIVKDPKTEPTVAAELGTFDIVLSDEVEYCINPAGNYIFSRAVNATNRYAFSGTADKGNGSMISFQNGLADPAVSGNLGLIKFFGPSLVYRRPLDRIVNLVDITTESLYKADLTGIVDSGNKYLDAMTALFTCPEVCDVIVEIVKRYKNLFIPINNLQSIIGTWIESYFLGRFRILLVCGEGYIYYGLDGIKTSLTLQEACDYILSGVVDVIPSTSSGFRALDFPNLSNILVFSGKIAGSVLQQIGRVARQPEMTIITLRPGKKKRIPIYSKGCVEREEMILEYYKYCDIRKITYTEEEFKNLPTIC